MANGKLDNYDQRILDILQEDARIDVTKISRKISLSDTPVRARIKWLQEAGFVKRYITVLDRVKVGLPVMVVLMIRLKDPDTKLFEKFERLVTDMAEVQFVLHVSGVWNFVLHVTAATPQAYHSWLMESITCHGFIAATESAFLLKDCKSNGSLKLNVSGNP